MLLKNKNVVICGAGVAIGSAVTKAFAKEEAKVFLAGRTYSKLENVKKRIEENSELAEIAVVDAMNIRSVEKQLDEIMTNEGQPDISFHAISINDIQGNYLIAMDPENFMLPVSNAMKSYFITGTAAVLMASDKASASAATVLNLTGGEIAD